MTTRNAQLAAVIASLQAMDNAKVTGILEKQLAEVVAPLKPVVIARILSIPVKGRVPYHQPPGLRARIAACVETWGKIAGTTAQAGIEVNPSRMPSGQKSLPLMMEGVKRFRHPVFARPHTSRDEQTWETQESHPYFYAAVGDLGPASRAAMQRAVDQITRDLEGA